MQQLQFLFIQPNLVDSEWTANWDVRKMTPLAALNHAADLASGTEPSDSPALIQVIGAPGAFVLTNDLLKTTTWNQIKSAFASFLGNQFRYWGIETGVKDDRPE